MLPDRSKRFASTEDGELPRLRLAENWQLAVIAFIMCGLFVVIFPRKALVEKLYTQEKLDGLTLSYIENLHRTEPDNADLSILLGRARRERLDLAALEALLRPVIDAGDARQRLVARRMLLDACERAVQGQGDEAAAPVKARMRVLLEALSKDGVPPEWADDLARQAFRAEQSALALEFIKQAVAHDGGRASAELAAQALDANAREALGLGRHALAAEYFLLARHQVRDMAKARELFKQGIGALMAASLYDQAMQAAEAHLGDLADDPDTLRYLMRTALAAGDPQRAAHYARRLVFDNGGVAGASGQQNGGRP